MPRWKELPEELDPQIREFAEHLRRLVDRSGLTVSEIADRTGYSRSSWERYLGGRLMPSRESVVAFAEVTDARDEQLMAEWGAADRAWSRAELRNEAALRALRAAEPGSEQDVDDDAGAAPGGRPGRGLRGVLGRGRRRGEDVSGAAAIPPPEEIPGPGPGRPGAAPERPAGAAYPERPVRPDAAERSAVRPGPPPPPEGRGEEPPGRRRTGAGTGAGTGGDAGTGAGTDGTGEGSGRTGAADAPSRDDETAKLRAVSRPAPAPAREPEQEQDPDPARDPAATSRIPVVSTTATAAPPPAKSWPLRRVLLAGLVTLLLTGSCAGAVYVAHGLITDPGVEEQDPRGGPPPDTDTGPAGSAPGSPSGSASGSGPGSGSEPLPEGVECRGADCTGRDPDEMGCGGDFARTTKEIYVGDMLLEIRYSKPCRAAWARITAAAPGSTVTALAEAPGEEPVREDASAGTSEGFTAMVPAERLADVRACAALPDGTADCTTGTPP
ncbi:helix-turn-helix domain-containing protein [Streptomyces sp. MAR4 CNX-425]|uniref:helix-turn-helix domain-containing protein n=1 Tax=Streptomyces sp. MAR4 CNX-425 TaxID=3406343 RepID=UPI003B500DCF